MSVVADVVNRGCELRVSLVTALDCTLSAVGACAISSLIWGDPEASSGPRRAYRTVYQREQGFPADELAPVDTLGRRLGPTGKTCEAKAGLRLITSDTLNPR